MTSLQQAYRRFGVITVASVYLLILVGGIVRSTGSGMGCPDWPKCFGQWVPPTHISQLPPNYKEVFKVAGKEIADFNAVHTWVEYINRLIGVLIGFFIFIALVLSFSYWKANRKVFWISLVSFIGVAFQGWLGSKVVSTNLLPIMVTVHMLVALLIVGLLIHAVFSAFPPKPLHQLPTKAVSKLSNWVLVCIVLGVVQIVLGTQVREKVDLVASLLNGQQRETWMEQLGMVFYIHRSYSLVILAVHGYFLYELFRWVGKPATIWANPLLNWGNALMMLLIIETLLGVVMAYFSIPKFAQPLHLLLGTLTLGVQYVLLLLLGNMGKSEPSATPAKSEPVQWV